MHEKMNYKSKWEKGLSYKAYRKLVSDLIDNDKSTGPIQSESLLEYSKLNQHRMNRLDKTLSIEKIKELTKLEFPNKLKFLVITEGWCGDASQIVPVIDALAKAFNIDVRFLLRDENLDLIDLHLVNGGRSIPIMLWLDENFELINKWGPRPRTAQQMVMDYKNLPEPKVEYAEFTKSLHLWYAKDKQQSMMIEWIEMNDAIQKR